MKSLNKNFSISLIVTLAILISQCETKEIFYRPDLPQKLCTIGIFDIDDTTIYDVADPLPFNRDTVTYARNISFEKSFQFEYPEEINDSLREFSFRISNDNEDMFVYQDNHAIRNLELKIPNSTNFESGRKYFLHASEKGSADISAVVEVPAFPPELLLESIKTETITLDKPYPNNCLPDKPITVKNVEIEFSFSNINPDSYYAILLTGSYSDSRSPYFIQNGSNLFKFSLLGGNTNGFIHTLEGRKSFQGFCPNRTSSMHIQYPVSAYFIDGSKIPGDICTLKILTEYQNQLVPPSFVKCFKIRLMSIPEELYLFEKSLYTYSKVSDDPFAEPANLKGNIKGGNGVFAICRSRELVVYPDNTIRPNSE